MVGGVFRAWGLVSFSVFWVRRGLSVFCGEVGRMVVGWGGVE